MLPTSLFQFLLNLLLNNLNNFNLLILIAGNQKGQAILKINTSISLYPINRTYQRGG